jgi:hypothetical protein
VLVAVKINMSEPLRKLSSEEELNIWDRAACGRHATRNDEGCFDMTCQYCTRTFQNLRDLTERITELTIQNNEFKENEREEIRIRTRLANLLHQTANALHDGPLEKGFWSWHDVPMLAAQAIAKIKELETVNETDRRHERS